MRREAIIVDSMRTLLLMLGLLAGSVAVANELELLPPEQAFAMTATVSGDEALLNWRVAPGYFMYRHRFKFAVDGIDVPLEQAQIPAGERRDDPIFGDVEALRGNYTVSVPLPLPSAPGLATQLTVTSQGCADIGVCYPPLTRTLTLDTVGSAGGAGGLVPLLSGLDPIFGGDSSDDFLPPDLAFVLSTYTASNGSLVARWEIADGYYLYREKINAEVVEPAGARVVFLQTPTGIAQTDEYFGEMEVFYGEVEARIGIDAGGAAPVTLDLGFQGCALAGLCYPPLTRRASFPAFAGLAQGSVPDSTPTGAAELSQQDRIAQSLLGDNLAWSLAAFFGFGLLLTFTPCVLPMVPILSSIIIGEGAAISTRRAFSLSAVYVLAMALTYTLVGVAAGLLGSGLQAAFQNVFVLGAFSAVFVWLAGAMFGWYELSLPARWQTFVSGISSRQRAGRYTGVAVMGVLSALIVGPCVAAPLAGALIYIGQTGDALLGGAALFAMSLGMGVPLLIVGTSAGRLMPTAGAWMDGVKALFGFVLLGVAVYLIGRVLPESVTMLLWAGLAVGFAVYHGVMRRLPADASAWQQTMRGVGLVVLIYGGLILAGFAAGGTDPLRPLDAFAGAHKHAELPFQRVADVQALDAELRSAAAAGQPVMLDYYADWCVSCKEMEKYTFTDPQVHEALGTTKLLQVDVTRNSEADQALLQRYGLYGPPAILFFDATGSERRAHRLVGFVPAERFAKHVRQAIR